MEKIDLSKIEDLTILEEDEYKGWKIRIFSHKLLQKRAKEALIYPPFYDKIN